MFFAVFKYNTKAILANIFNILKVLISAFCIPPNSNLHDESLSEENNDQFLDDLNSLYSGIYQISYKRISDLLVKTRFIFIRKSNFESLKNVSKTTSLRFSCRVKDTLYFINKISWTRVLVINKNSIIEDIVFLSFGNFQKRCLSGVFFCSYHNTMRGRK